MLSTRIVLCFTLLIFFSCAAPTEHIETDESPARTAEEELETFQLEDGFKIQLVAAEPLVEDPILIQFDEDGRLWVVEMRGYMTDIEGSEEEFPIGRISVLEDDNGDGEMDKSTIYLDSLVMPRALGLVQGGALVAENNSLWFTQDTDGDLKADSKELLDFTYSSNGIPEHSDNGFVRNVDNWYYSAKSRLRYRYDDGVWIRDSTEFRGQWGITQDDQGRLLYNYNWSQLHGDLVPANYLYRNPNHSPSSGIDHGLTIDRKIFPARSNLAVNRGYIPGTLDSAGRLLEFTSACSPTVYRSSLFPEEYYGNVFVMENAGNLIKRNVVSQNGILLEAKDPNPGKEFLASTDERFRPVHGAIGPDGGFYVADMYRGIVQHGSYMTPYLKEQTLARGLDKTVHLGRIWRIVPEDWEPTSTPKLSKMTDQELIDFLSHSDGFFRDMAQRLLVERKNESIKPDLENLVKSDSSELGRFHALWTLEGMGLLEADLLFPLLDSESSLLQSNAIRLLEGLAVNSSVVQDKLAEKMIEMASTAPIEVALQLALSSSVMGEKEYEKVVIPVFQRFGEQTLIRDALMSSLEDREYSLLTLLWKDSFPKTQHQEIFLENLTAAVVNKGNPEELKSLLSLASNTETQDSWKAEVVLNSMAIQAGGKQESEIISLDVEPEIFRNTSFPIAENRMEMLKTLFTWPGHQPSETTASAIALDENALKQFSLGRQKYLASCAGCHGSNGAGVNRMGPPLAGSEWVLGDERRLALIMLHGIEGPIEVAGKIYDAPDILPVMPSHSTMDDGNIAAILTYIRNEWGNQAAPVSGRTIGGTRHTSQGRVYPWSAAELNDHINSLSPPNPD